MAFTEAASARAAAHAARLAVHAASGLAWSAGLPDAARCLRAAEGAVRAALAQLQAAQCPETTLPGKRTVKEEVRHSPKRKRQRKRKGRGQGEGEEAVQPGELQPSPMAVDEQPAVGAPAEEPSQPSARARGKPEEKLAALQLPQSSRKEAEATAADLRFAEAERFGLLSHEERMVELMGPDWRDKVPEDCRGPVGQGKGRSSKYQKKAARKK